MASYPTALLTPDEYLAFERRAEFKHEYVAGRVVPAHGRSREHCLIVGNIATTLHLHAKTRDLLVLMSLMRVTIPSRHLYAYPDVVAVAGSGEVEDAQKDTLLNPTVIVEVLSPSTERFDRGRTFAFYRTMPSLQEYLLVSQNEAHVEQYVRQDDGSWRLVDYQALDDRVELASIGGALPLSEIYDKVQVSDLTEDEQEQ